MGNETPRAFYTSGFETAEWAFDGLAANVEVERYRDVNSFLDNMAEADKVFMSVSQVDESLRAGSTGESGFRGRAWQRRHMGSRRAHGELTGTLEHGRSFPKHKKSKRSKKVLQGLSGPRSISQTKNI